ncbi:C2H2 C2HC zinc finger [Fusarium phyllophilum]|uniref:C2H2 C2HC zinc finger n=1 Tax=Fusarium phyllophilum TaxID=47803 RepID=A0A8H5JZ56_9HYPO|nr:C2H2 C2HC zinc finger [Fusarium phyllophilum]
MPTVDFFKSLTTIQRADRLWGVYLLVLEKSGGKPSIYIGSGTAGKVSIYARLHQYDNLMKTREWFSGILKFLCDKAEDGWGVTHKGVLVSSPLPSKSEQLLLRALTLLLETLFSIIFWATQH